MTLLAAFLLMSASIVCLHSTTTANSVIPNVDHDLRCETDYLYTINCSLSLTSAHTCRDNCSYWLVFLQRLLIVDEKFECVLSSIGEYYYCSLDKSLQTPVDDYDYTFDDYTFVDTDTFEVSLCHKISDASESCEVLHEGYKPSENITPNTPCCLAVIHNASNHHFRWKSGYENLPSYLDSMLEYQLQYNKRGHKENPTSLEADQKEISVDDDHFKADTEYTIRVRSRPDQRIYMGQWSEWSSAVHWKTASVRNNSSTNTVVPALDKKVVIPLCMLAPLLLLLCYAPVVKLRQSTYIPTPAPYFQSLYSDCQGDFKTWVVTPAGNEVDLLKTEETLQIDILTKSTVVVQDDGASQLQQQMIQEGSPCGSMSPPPASDASLLGMPYCVTPGPPPPPVSVPRDLLKSLSLSSATGSIVEGDSGCWLCSATSLEGDSPWYRNEYCTLSDTLSVFQPSEVVAVEHRCSESSPSGDYVNEC